ncbi:aminoacyl-tRNA deacylase [Gordonia sp. i37]|uniref:aminoacyl-tRNA deacylase n=1 Tax=Gordonia sp. i37 TaxID=1961707 RepID=UPI0009AC8F09|nr:aminoacyl-tRNA deacylase [Gordonia sp. i37]OPX14165.1 aminoacyl-tRNA deacylase [Gordonia sp. i37]
MAATPAVAALTAQSIPHRVHRYRHDPRTTAYGAEAVDVLGAAFGVAAEQILKTLVIELSGTRSGLAVAVVPVPRSLSLKAAAAALDAGRAVMADAKAVTRSTGYVLGGGSPIGQRTTLPTVVDESVLRWPHVWCSAGRRGLEVEVAPADLIAITSAVTADICAAAS